MSQLGWDGPTFNEILAQLRAHARTVPGFTVIEPEMVSICCGARVENEICTACREGSGEENLHEEEC